MADLIDRKQAIEALGERPMVWTDSDYELGQANQYDVDKFHLKLVPSVQPDGYVKIPKTGIDDLSDGFHTFRQLYYQRMMLFATIVKQNKDKAWKSLRHEDGELCFGGGWFIVGVDTPEGSYTYHYEDAFYSLFDCKELKCGRHWDGHTEKDVTRLLSLPSAQPEQRWIPCSERLPEEDHWLGGSGKQFSDQVLVTIINHSDDDVWVDMTYTIDGEWMIELPRHCKIVAWMPLPPVYREEGD